DFHVEQRQRDRNPGPAIEYLVQKAVARILIMQLVADEVELLEEVVVEGDHASVAIGIDVRGCLAGHDRRVGDAPLPLAPDRVELVEIRSGVQLRVLDAGNHQCRDREIRVGTESGMAEGANELVLNHWQRRERSRTGYRNQPGYSVNQPFETSPRRHETTKI